MINLSIYIDYFFMLQKAYLQMCQTGYNIKQRKGTPDEDGTLVGLLESTSFCPHPKYICHRPIGSFYGAVRRGGLSASGGLMGKLLYRFTSERDPLIVPLHEFKKARINKLDFFYLKHAIH